ncbi:MAG: phospholipid carrier-dependent glycosyltransferase [Elusimicrobia bacterium]|nr:phospholipid carrier-dependent glycosyltransferase [Elusimicrobiota bacterium]
MKTRADWAPSVAALATAAALLPFTGKAYHIDDALFLRLARQIAAHPLRPFDFFFNWSVTPVPAWLVYLNPPLDSYYLAAVGHWAREREVWTHLAFLPFAAACAALMMMIARRLCRRPWPATLASLAAPAFFVSATSVMADVPLLTFWLAGVLATMVAAEPGREAWLWAAAAAAAAAALTKYFGLALVPLCLVYWLFKTKRASIHLLSFLCTPAAVAAWGLYSKTQCGFFHPIASGGFALGPRPPGPPSTLVAAAFLGGGALWPLALLAAARSLGRWSLIAAAAVAAAALTASAVPAAVRAEWLVLCLGGGLLIAAAAAGAAARPDAESLLLALWLFGTLVFAGLVNWTVNERALLPAFFPAALLAARGLEASPRGLRLLDRWPWVLVPTMIMSLLLARADAGQASASRDFAAGRARAFLREGRDVFFIGHWGFQYYMEREGARAFDYRRPALAPGARLCVSLDNSATFPVAKPLRAELSVLDDIRTPAFLGLELTDVPDGTAGFYDAGFGPVPFALGRDAADEFLIQAADPAFQR